jgi:hypothetical protein
MSATLLISFLLCLAHFTLADPATLRFSDCAAENTTVSRKFNVENVYGQVITDEYSNSYLDLVVIGNTPETIVGYYDGGTKLGRPFCSALL